MSTLPSVPLRVACYARVSTEDQAERQTVTAQTDFLRRYCELHGCQSPASTSMTAYLGATPLEDRPEGRRLLQDAESGAFSAVLVYRLDRLGRSLKTLLAAHERLDKAGVAIRSGTEPFDTASPIGKFLFSLLGSMAELERSTITERMTMGRDRVAGPDNTRAGRSRSATTWTTRDGCALGPHRRSSSASPRPRWSGASSPGSPTERAR